MRTGMQGEESGQLALQMAVQSVLQGLQLDPMGALFPVQ